MTLGTVVIGGGAVHWRTINLIQSRPTFTQVEEMIEKFERGNLYAIEQGTIKAKLIELAKDIEANIRHTDKIKAVVEELLLIATAEQKARVLVAANLAEKERRDP